MTRINCVNVADLSPKHLVAEYRELPRCFKLMEAAQDRGESLYDKRNPSKYTLGAGHVRFFYDKGLYLLKRQSQIIEEMLRRDYNPKHTDPHSLVPAGLAMCRMKDWTPTKEDMVLNWERLHERDTVCYYLQPTGLIGLTRSKEK